MGMSTPTTPVKGKDFSRMKEYRSVVARAFNPSPQEAETDESLWVRGQPAHEAAKATQRNLEGSGVGWGIEGAKERGAPGN